MKPTQQLSVIVSMLAWASAAQADPVGLESLMGSTLYEQAVFADAYVGAAAGPGTDTVFGNILANAYVDMGANTHVNGNIRSNSYIITGDSATVVGNTLAVNATTVGPSSVVFGDVQAGDDVTLGPSAQVVGTVQYGGAIIIGPGATSGTQSQNTSVPVIADEHQAVVHAQQTLDAMTGGEVLAAGVLALDTTFTAGVYDVPGFLNVAAGRTITLDAQGEDNAFIFNVGGYLTISAGVNVVVVNGML
jgi:cytoskeletal protein CcmA (bactofilin family)